MTHIERLFLIMLVLLFNSCEKTVTVSVTGISLSANSVTLIEGETQTITATVLPDNATDKQIIWDSSDVNVVTVQDGVLMAIKAGEALVTAETVDGGKTASCKVFVKEKEDEGGGVDAGGSEGVGFENW